jgi:hypothetical protein
MKKALMMAALLLGISPASATVVTTVGSDQNCAWFQTDSGGSAWYGISLSAAAFEAQYSAAMASYLTHNSILFGAGSGACGGSTVSWAYVQ